MLLGDALRQITEEEGRPASLRHRHHLPKRWWLMLIPIALTGVVVVAIPRIPHATSTELIPAGIQSKLDFTPLLPRQNADTTIKQTSFAYSSEVMQLSFTVSSKTLGTIAFGEQATPQDFVTTPDSYTKLIDSINRYATFTSHTGTVYLTRPASQASGQTAVMNTGEVVVFVRSAHDLSDGQWQAFFATLYAVPLENHSGGQ